MRELPLEPLPGWGFSFVAANTHRPCTRLYTSPMNKAPWYALKVNGYFNSDTIYPEREDAEQAAKMYTLATVEIIEVDYNGNPL